MESLQTVLRSLRETKARRNHLDIFREFLGHLDRIGRRPRVRAPAPAKRGAKKGARRRAQSGRV